jgi:predicted nucleic acid-binding protein
MAKYKFFQAGEKELDQLYELGKQFRQEFRKIFPQVDEDKAYKILDLLLSNLSIGGQKDICTMSNGFM